MVKTGWFICNCGKKVKLTKHKFDTKRHTVCQSLIFDKPETVIKTALNFS